MRGLTLSSRLSTNSPSNMKTNEIPPLYDPTDNAQFTNRHNLQPPTSLKDIPTIVESVARPTVLTVDTDYKGNASSTKQFPKRRERRTKKKKRQRTDTGLAAEDNAHQYNVSRGHVAKLRRDADLMQVDAGNIKADRDSVDGKEEESDGDEEDSHYAAMVRARRKAVVRKQKQSTGETIDGILKAINDVNDGDTENKAMELDEDVMERGARLLYDEMHAFLERVPAVQMVSQRLSHSDRTTPSAATDTTTIAQQPKLEADDEIKPEQKFSCSSDPMIVDDSNVHHSKDTNQPTTTVDGNPSKCATINMATPAPPPTTTQTDDDDDKPGLSGIAATLKKLRETGQLAKKRHQSGRARDERLDYDSPASSASDDENDARKKNRSRPHVKLAYLDDQGNELTPKEAFRMLCHKFHGNAPGKNKNEKRLKKILEDMRVREMNQSDMPLASVAALRQETRKTGSAHVVLSGVEAFQVAGSNMQSGLAKERMHEDGSDAHFDNEARKEGIENQVEEKVQFTIDGSGTNTAKRRRRH